MRPIFIGGCDRSGTTLLGALLGAHPDVVTVREMPFKFALLRGTANPGRLASDLRVRVWGVDAQRALAAPSGREAIERLVSLYAEAHDRAGASVWVDHTPLNLRFAPTLIEAFPDARFVHLVRDGRAVAASLKRADFGPSTASAAAAFWLRALAPALAAETMPGIEAVRVLFRDLVAQPEETLRGLCEQIGLDYRDEMARGGGYDVPEYSRPIHELVDDPPDPSRIDAWQTELTPREIEIFESLTGDMLPLLGFEPVHASGAPPMTTWERRRDRVVDVVGARRKRARARRRQSSVR